MTKTYLISARRSAVAPRNGALAHLELHELAKPVLNAVLQDAGILPQRVGELIVANSLGAGGNPARVIALGAGWPETIAGLSIDRQCVGGLDALILADAMIRSGQHDVVVAGGVESYSRQPIRMRRFSDGREPEAYDQAQFTPWPDRNPDMADAAHQLAQQLGIGKAEQDHWAINSHAKAITTVDIVEVAGVKEDSFRRNLTQKHCDRARILSGGITAANMAVAADGAAFVVMASEKFVRSSQIEAVEFIAGKTLGGDPLFPGLAPVAAIKKTLIAAGVKANQLTVAEIMEAFAVQAIACQQGANIALEIVNQKGGALSRGHPIGASGAILAVRLFHDLQKNGGIGLAAIAAAGGLGSAVVLRRT
jgi:acetyl-CoA C-acetyltransferase